MMLLLLLLPLGLLSLRLRLWVKSLMLMLLLSLGLLPLGLLYLGRLRVLALLRVLRLRRGEAKVWDSLLSYKERWLNQVEGCWMQSCDCCSSLIVGWYES